jgi:hypothetical protein
MISFKQQEQRNQSTFPFSAAISIPGPIEIANKSKGAFVA